MFKYAPKRSILRELQVNKTGAYWDRAYGKRLEILNRYGITEDIYTMQNLIYKAFPKVCFYSKKSLKYVPVMGRLFPVAMFDETEV